MRANAMEVSRLVALAVAVSLLTGCATLRSQLPLGQVEYVAPVAQPAESPVVDTSGQPVVDTSGQDALALVEDFLQRTQAYQAPDSQHGRSVPVPVGVQRVPDRADLGSTPAPRLRELGSKVASTEDAFANTQVLLDQTKPTQPALALPVLRSISVQSGTTVIAEKGDPVESNTTNQAIDSHTDVLPSLVDRMANQLSERAEETKDFESAWSLSFFRLALFRDEVSADAGRYLSERPRQVLSALVDVVMALRPLGTGPSESAESALTRIDGLRDIVIQHCDPVVSSIALCRKVVTFGVYEEMLPSDLVAGRDVQTIVYSEVRNLQTERTADDRFRTQLATRIEVLTADGRSVWNREEPEIVDVCRRPRRDFFIAQRVTLPPTLPAGDYVLKMTVEDKLSKRVNEAIHPFTLNSALSMASRG